MRIGPSFKVMTQSGQSLGKGAHWTLDLMQHSGRTSWQRRPLGWERKGEKNVTRQHANRDNVEGE